VGGDGEGTVLVAIASEGMCATRAGMMVRPDGLGTGPPRSDSSASVGGVSAGSVLTTAGACTTGGTGSGTPSPRSPNVHTASSRNAAGVVVVIVVAAMF
jgi:hypothetical protein